MAKESNAASKEANGAGQGGWVSFLPRRKQPLLKGQESPAASNRETWRVGEGRGLSWVSVSKVAEERGGRER